MRSTPPVEQHRVKQFFEFCRERHSIHLKRQAGESWPWTDDSVLQKYKFTNVFRELDRTTVWFKESVRDKLADKPEVLLATVFFRYFNRISSAEVLFWQMLLDGRGSPWNVFLQTGDTSECRAALRSVFPDGPWVTGAYMIKTPNGMDKLNGVLDICSVFYHRSDWRAKAECLINGWGESENLTMESFTRWLQQFPGMGPFLAYEVACDLQYTKLLCNAPDIMTWANVGPGCRRGLNRLCERMRPVIKKRGNGQLKMNTKYSSPIRERDALVMMRDLLRLSQSKGYCLQNERVTFSSDLWWPQGWRKWDMRTVEHSLCEFDKYLRAKEGDGEPKQLYRRGLNRLDPGKVLPLAS